MSNKKKKTAKTKQQTVQPAVKKDQVKPIRTGGFSIWTGFFIGVLVVAAAGGFFWIKSKGRAITPGAFKNYNVLLITTDTTRADHLPMYGYGGVKTPELDKLAEHS